MAVLPHPCRSEDSNVVVERQERLLVRHRKVHTRHVTGPLTRVFFPWGENRPPCRDPNVAVPYTFKISNIAKPVTSKWDPSRTST